MGHVRAAMVSGVPAPFPLPCLSFSMRSRSACFSTGSPSFTTEALGVGHCRAAPGNVFTGAWLPAWYIRCVLSTALGVGQDEEPFAAMRRANFRRREKSSLTSVAH